MINIIPTLTVMDTIEEYKVMISNYISSNSDIFRCNATRFSNEVYFDSISTLKEVYYKEKGTNFRLLLDIPCPKDKYRVEFTTKENQIQIRRNEIIKVVFSRKDLYGNNTLYVENLQYKFSRGEKIIIGDGDVLLKVIAVYDEYIECVVENNGEIGYRKACYLGENYCHIISHENRKKFMQLIEMLKPEYIALSFVETYDEVLEMKELLKSKGITSKVISKVESKKAINNLEEIIKVSNGVMLGRGDLALSSGYESLPMYQNEFFRLSNLSRCETYVATDILNSLRNNNFPNRAEVCDLYTLMEKNVKNIVLSGPLCRYEKYLMAAKTIRDMEKKLGR